MRYTGTRQYVRLYLDTDRNSSSGYANGGIGANYLLENDHLFRYSGPGGGAWGWTLVKTVPHFHNGDEVSWTLSRSDLGSPAAIDLVGQVEPPRETTAKVTQVLASTPTAPIATSDATNISYTVSFTDTPTYVRIFLDTDRSATTGYSHGGVGADYLIENGSLFRYSGAGGSNWSWTRVKAVNRTQNPGNVTLTIARADIGSPAALNFVAESDPPLVTSGVMSQILNYNVSTADIANPERGFYNEGGHCEATPFDEALLRSHRVNGANTLVICVFYLAQFKTSPINIATLNFFQSQMNTVRAAGLKVVVRFAYTDTDNVDASLAQIMAHMDQLAPYFAQNSDVMFVMQEGWIGQWGEGAFSLNFGNSNSLSQKNIDDRTAVINKLLQVLP